MSRLKTVSGKKKSKWISQKRDPVAKLAPLERECERCGHPFQPAVESQTECVSCITRPKAGMGRVPPSERTYTPKEEM